MEGIDVSQWQGMIDFQAVEQAGTELVYIKASEGIDFVDPYFGRNYRNARAAGLPVGFYHYLTARSASAARQEAHHFVSVTEGLLSEGKMIMDIEDLSGLAREEINQIALSFLQSVEEFSNKEPAIYADAYNASAYCSDGLTKWPLWIAQYGVAAPDTDNPWGTGWTGWQYTDLGNIPGIRGNVDRSIFREEILDGQTQPVELMAERSSYTVTEITYTVQPGDSLSRIAERYHLTVREIAAENAIENPNLIYPGQQLVLRIRDDRKQSDTYILYQVQPGNTLSGIAAQYGTTVNALVRTNGLPNPNLIYPGQIIKIRRQ